MSDTATERRLRRITGARSRTPNRFRERGPRAGAGTGFDDALAPDRAPPVPARRLSLGHRAQPEPRRRLRRQHQSVSRLANMAASTCLCPDTPVLQRGHGVAPAGEICVATVLVGFDELPRPEHAEAAAAVVEKLWWSAEGNPAPRDSRVRDRHHRGAPAGLQARNFRWWPNESARAGGKELRRIP